MSATAIRGHVELVPGRLYVTGGTIPMDGRASWAPSSAIGHQPSNAYVLCGETDVVVDTGTAFVRDGLMRGLAAILPAGAPISIFLTRAQLDCVGSLGRIVEAYDVRDIFTGGVPNPFDQFDATPASSMGVTRSPAEPPVQIFNPALRVLPTYWGYDAGTKTAFTADCFTHGVLDDPDGIPVIDDPALDRVTQREVDDHLHAAFWWLQLADAREHIADQIRGFFASHEVDIIAPSRGCVLQGRPIVDRHVELLVNAITGVPHHG